MTTAFHNYDSIVTRKDEEKSAEDHHTKRVNLEINYALAASVLSVLAVATESVRFCSSGKAAPHRRTEGRT